MTAPDAGTNGAPLRIVHVMRAPVGGLFRHVLDLAGEQARRGHAVGIVADKLSADALTAQRLADIEPKLKLGLALIPMSRKPGLGDLSTVRAVTRVVRAADPHIVHGHGAKGGAYARLAKAWLKTSRLHPKAFYTPHGGSLHYQPGTAAGRIFGVLERIMGTLTDGLIFESDFARKAYAQLAGEGGAAGRVIPNGVGEEDFVQHAPAPDAASFLFIGELRRLKGVDVLLEAMARIVPKHPVRTVIVGSGAEGEALKTEARRRGLELYVTFAGPMAARDALPLGHCLVVPSRAESFPYVVLEAGAAGKPLIATRVGGIPEIIAGTDIELIAPGSVGALVNAMERLLADPERAQAQAAALRQVVQEKFTVTAMTDAVLDFYRSSLWS